MSCIWAINNFSVLLCCMEGGIGLYVYKWVMLQSSTEIILFVPDSE